MSTLSANNPEQDQRARQLSKDGLLFLSLALVALLVAGITFTVSHEKPELLTAMAVGVASALVFGGMGVMKLAQARRAGLRVAGLSAAGLAAAYYLAVLFMMVCGWLLPRLFDHELGRYTELVSWSLPLMLCLAALTHTLRRKSATALQGSGAATTASILCWIYIGGLVGSADWHWLVFGARPMDPRNFGFWLHAPWEFIVALATAGAVGLIFLIIAVLGLRREARANGMTPAAARSRAAVRFSAGLLVLTCVALGVTRMATYWGAAAALFCFSLAAVAGAFFARLRQHGPVSIRRRLLFTAPLATLALLLVLTAGLAGSAYSYDTIYDWHGSYAPWGDWIWHIPEPLRAPLAQWLGQRSLELKVGVYVKGLVSVAELQTEALMPGALSSYSGAEEAVWRAWSVRDPQAALTAARAVTPPPSGTKLNSMAYDMGAGFVIGSLGTDAEVRARLTGYSAVFVNGMLMGLTPERRERLKSDILAYIRSQRYNSLGLRWFSIVMPADFHQLTIGLIDDPATNTTLLNDVLNGQRYHPDLTSYALKSSNVTVRKMSMTALARVYWSLEPAAMQQLIKIMQGVLPNSDVAEQRAAARLVSVPLGLPSAAWRVVATPLTTAEQAQLDVLIKKAQEWLTARGGHP